MDFEISQKIKKKRIERGLTYEALAKIVGVNRTTVMRWESGYISNMRQDKIAALAKCLDMQPEELLGIDLEQQSHAQKLYERMCDDKLYIGVCEKIYDLSPEKLNALAAMLEVL